jgi:hypothetical protein
LEFYQSHLRRPQFSLAEVAVLVAAVAAALRWPVLLLPTLAVVLYLFCERIGLSLIWLLVLVSLVGLVLGFTVKPLVPH